MTAEAVPALGLGDYLRFSQLVEERFGLHFPEKRRTELELGVRRAFAASNCTDLDSYYRLLQDPYDGAVEMDRLVNALTVSESHFFRDAGQCDALYYHVLPQIIQRRRAMRIMRIWSAGCASGEEPYSIAMMLRQLLPDVDEWSITILGTDVNIEALDRARKAVYSEWAFREERAKQWQLRYFRPLGGNRYELIPEVRRMVTFSRHNLAEDDYPSFETNTTLMDLILCRNVMIYFAPPVIHKVIERFHEALVDGGWLVVGHSEASLTTYRRFQVRNFPDAVLYQRTAQPLALPSDRDWPVTPPAGQGRAWDLPMPVPGDTPSSAFIGRGPCPPPPENGDPLERAQELLDYGRSEEARALLLELVKFAPALMGRCDPSAEAGTGFVEPSGPYARACALLGRAYANLGCWSEAEHWCRQALHYDKLAPGAYYTLALVLQHQGRLDQAIEAMKKVIYIDRTDVLGHFGLANLYHRTGQWQRAQKSLENARRLLEGRAAEELLPDSGGITAGRLRDAIVRQQQQWAAEAHSLHLASLS